MSNNKRFFGEIFSGLLALGGATDSSTVEKPVASQTVDVHVVDGPPSREAGRAMPAGRQDRPAQIEIASEPRLESDPKFCAEHPIEAELRVQNVPLDKMRSALLDAAELVRSNRYGDDANEEKYFDACRDTERWASIEKSIQYASEKTGVPERVLIAMGFIESQFKEDADRSDTHVHGPYQMTLDTAQEAAMDAKECFGFPIVVNSTEDLHETKTAVRLAALRLRALTNQYGQLGLAVMDYAGGRVSLEKKITQAFPNVDLGARDWNDMQRHHLAERNAQKRRDEILKRMKQGRSTNADRQALREAVRTFEAAGAAYTKAKNTWKQKRANLPHALADAGVTPLALYELEKSKGGDIAHSITYTLALDDIARRAKEQIDE